MKKRELILISILTVMIAVMDITGIPIAFLFIKYLCPEWRLGFTASGLAAGLKRYGIIGVITAVIGFVVFYAGLKPFDRQPSIEKVLVEGVIYYIGVAIIEELYVRGLLLNLIEIIFYKKQNSTLTAVILSSAVFGLGHIFGTLNQPVLVIISKVIWTIGMGMFFGMVYKKTNNLWLPIIIHFLINVCALPYCFSSVKGYADLTLYIIMPVYILLGIYRLKNHRFFNFLFGQYHRLCLRYAWGLV